MPRAKTLKSVRALRVPTAPRQIVLRVAICDIIPEIWRVIRVPDEFTLHQLHRVIQLVFGWLDYHLYEFRVRGRAVEGPHPEAQGRTTKDVPLIDLKLKAGSRFDYVYDFGDGWEHSIEVVEFLPMPDGKTMDWSPRLLDGARAGPPEDAGGPPGYERVLAALGDPKHPEHGMYKDWVGPGYDPDRFDLRSIDRALALASGWGAV